MAEKAREGRRVGRTTIETIAAGNAANRQRPRDIIRAAAEKRTCSASLEGKAIPEL